MSLSRPVVATSVVVGAATLGGLIWYLYSRNKVRHTLARVRSFFIPTKDEGFAESSQLFEPKEKKVLVLGLSGSGKTEMLRDLAAAATDRLSGFGGEADSKSETPEPTQGIKVTTVSRNGRTYHFWEVGGGSAYRKYWSHFFEDTDLLAFFVDAADAATLPEAYAELRNVLSDHRLKDVPLLIVANKQNLPDALSPEAILEESGISQVRSGGAVRVTGAGRGLGTHEEFYQQLFVLCDSLSS